MAQIGKSIIFRAVADDRSVLVVASGAKRIGEARIAAALSGAITKADAAFVRHHTGFAIGGVALIAHSTPPVTFLERSLCDSGQICVAAGIPRAGFTTTAAELETFTGGHVITPSTRRHPFSLPRLSRRWCTPPPRLAGPRKQSVDHAR